MRIPKRKGEKNNLTNPDPYLTQAKVNELINELNRLIKITRPKLVQEVQDHAKLGDFSENAAYQIAKGKLRGLNQRILIIEETLRQAIIINQDRTKDNVCLGCKVTVATDGQQKVYQILGAQETDPTQGIISHLSPIGAALLGHKKNDVVEVVINDQPVKYKIIKVE